MEKSQRTPQMKSERTVQIFMAHQWHFLFQLIILALMATGGLLLLASPAKAQNIVPHTVTYSTFQKDSLFSISIPDYFVETNDLDAEAVLQFKNVFIECYLMVIANPKSKTPQLYLSMMERQFKSELLQRGGSVIQETHKKIGGFESFQKEVEWQVNGEPLVFLVAFIDTPEVVFKIYGWTLAQHRQSLVHFRHTVDSFRLTNPRS